jgi:hypothetical protein
LTSLKLLQKIKPLIEQTTSGLDLSSKLFCNLNPLFVYSRLKPLTNASISLVHIEPELLPLKRL